MAHQTPPRPIVTDEMREQAAHKMLERLEKWEYFEHWASPTPLADLIKIASTSSNGYELAKELDDECWNVDSTLVEELDDFSSIIDGFHTEAIKQWVISNNIKPPLTAGTKVRFTYGWHSKTGVIADGDRYFNEGKYHISRDDEPRSGCFSIVEFERVEAVPCNS
jgi:hypothetical protein